MRRQALIRYVEVISWLLRRLIRWSKWQCLVLVVLAMIAVVGQLGAVGVLMTIVHAQTMTEPLSFVGFEVPKADQRSLLYLWLGGAMLLGTIGAIAGYLVESWTFKMAFDFMRRVLTLFFERLGIGSSGLGDDRAYAAKKMTMRNGFMVLRGMRSAIGMLPPFLMFVSASVVLLWLSPKMTLLVVLVLSFVLIPFILFSKSVMRASRAREFVTKDQGDLADELVRFLLSAEWSMGVRWSVARRYLRGEELENSAATLKAIMVTSNKVRMSLDIAQSLVLVSLLCLFASEHAADASQWAPFLSYLIVLRFMRKSLNVLTTKAASVNRFYPQLKVLRGVIVKQDMVSNSGGDSEWAFPRAGGGGGVRETERVGVGEVLPVVQRRIGYRNTADAVLEIIMPLVDPNDLAVAIGADGGSEVVGDLLKDVEKGGHGSRSEEVVELGGQLVARAAPVILIRDVDWRGLDEEEKSRVLEQGREHLLLPVIPEGDVRWMQEAEKAHRVMVMHGADLVGIGDWTWFASLPAIEGGSDRTAFYDDGDDEDELDDL